MSNKTRPLSLIMANYEFTPLITEERAARGETSQNTSPVKSIIKLDVIRKFMKLLTARRAKSRLDRNNGARARAIALSVVQQ